MVSTTLSDRTVEEIIACYVRGYTMRRAARQLHLTVKTVRNYYHLINHRMFQILDSDTQENRKKFEDFFRDTAAAFLNISKGKMDDWAAALYPHSFYLEQFAEFSEFALLKHRGFPRQDAKQSFLSKYTAVQEDTFFNFMIICRHAPHLTEDEAADIAVRQYINDLCKMLKLSGPLNAAPTHEQLCLAMDYLHLRRAKRRFNTTPASRKDKEIKSRESLIKEVSAFALSSHQDHLQSVRSNGRDRHL